MHVFLWVAYLINAMNKWTWTDSVEDANEDSGVDSLESTTHQQIGCFPVLILHIYQEKWFKMLPFENALLAVQF